MTSCKFRSVENPRPSTKWHFDLIWFNTRESLVAEEEDDGEEDEEEEEEEEEIMMTMMTMMWYKSVAAGKSRDRGRRDVH